MKSLNQLILYFPNNNTISTPLPWKSDKAKKKKLIQLEGFTWNEIRRISAL